MVEEGAEIRARAERTKGDFAGTLGFRFRARIAGRLILGVGGALAPHVVNAATRARILNFASGFADQFLEGRRGRGAEIGAVDADICVDVGDSFRLQLRSVRLHPFG